VPDAVVCDTEGECLERLGEVDVRKTLVVAHGKESHGGATGWVRIIKYTPNRIELEVDANEPGNVLLSEIWYPGWIAYDNGRRVDIGRADYLFRYLPVDKGYHRIIMIYSPRSLVIGRWVSIITLLSILGMLYRKRRSRW
jgi:uncharacterized membrane protein YfhO